MIEVEISETQDYVLYFIKGTDTLHREDGPAIECKSGMKEWWVNGKRHRDDGPAIESKRGLREWYKHGKRHRVDGPALIWPTMGIGWYIEGVNYTKEEWFEALNEERRAKALYSEYFIGD
jgi:hypothetical protein